MICHPRPGPLENIEPKQQRFGTNAQSRRRGQGGKERGKPDEDCHPGSGAGRAESAAASEAGVGFDVVYRVILDVLQRHEHVAESLSRYSRILTCTQPIQVAVTHLLAQLLDRT